MKVVVIGHGRVGKTTLLTAMRKNSLGRLFVGVPSQMESTVGLNHSTIQETEYTVEFIDFAGQMEYTVTHQFFLSKQNTTYLLCFDASAEMDEVISNIRFWLEYLFDLLHTNSNNSSLKPSFKVVLVGLKTDIGVKGPIETLNEKLCTEWKGKLPLHDKIFVVSSHQNIGVSELKEFILSLVNNKKAQQEGKQKAVPYFSWLVRNSLEIIKKKSTKVVMMTQELYELLPKETQGLIDHQKGWFPDSLEYLHSVGDIVKCDEFVCVKPELLGRMMASFICPKEVMNRLWVDKGRNPEVGTLTSDEVKMLLKTSQFEEVKNISPDEALEVMREFKMCYSVRVEEGTVHLFPSLRTLGDPKFIVPSEKDAQSVWYVGWRFQVVPGIVQQALFCRLLVECCESVKVKKEELELYNNGALIFKRSQNYRALVILSHDSRSIIFIPGADISENSSPLISVIKDFVVSNFEQHKEARLCTECFRNNLKMDEEGNSHINPKDCNFFEVLEKTVAILCSHPKSPHRVTLNELQGGLSPHEEFFKRFLESVSKIEQKSGKCFISYAWNPDKQENVKLQSRLEKLKKDLTEVGLEVLLDIRNMEGDIDLYMSEGIKNSDRICTPQLAKRASEESPNGPNNLQKELNSALARQKEDPKFIVPLIFEGSRSTSIPKNLPNILYLDFTKPEEYLNKMASLSPKGLIPMLLGLENNQLYDSLLQSFAVQLGRLKI